MLVTWSIASHFGWTSALFDKMNLVLVGLRATYGWELAALLSTLGCLTRIWLYLRSPAFWHTHLFVWRQSAFHLLFFWIFVRDHLWSRETFWCKSIAVPTNIALFRRLRKYLSLWIVVCHQIDAAVSWAITTYRQRDSDMLKVSIPFLTVFWYRWIRVHCWFAKFHIFGGPFITAESRKSVTFELDT